MDCELEVRFLSEPDHNVLSEPQGVESRPLGEYSRLDSRSKAK
jgi:hypothetical protein